MDNTEILASGKRIVIKAVLIIDDNEDVFWSELQIYDSSAEAIYLRVYKLHFFNKMVRHF